MQHVVIVHGWSDTSESFEQLTQFLKQSGFAVTSLWLGDYISLDDDVRIQDAARKMEERIRQKIAASELATPFDMIVHSTGSLVARQWIVAHYGQDVSACPLKRLLMLAPANFGSKLASMGQSMLGRVVKGWNNWFHTGKEMLDALELASPFQWRLAQSDLLLPPGVTEGSRVYCRNGVWPFVITGSHPYTSLLRKIVNENGSDGTVRVAAANLNTHGLTLDFAANENDPVVTKWGKRYDDESEFPFAVLPDRTHATIVEPLEPEEIIDIGGFRAESRLPALILQALNCDVNNPSEYQNIAKQWKAITQATNKLGDQDSKEDNPEYFHSYAQVNVEVVDDHGDPVDDYFMEFSAPDWQENDEPSVYFHQNVLEDVHVNGLRKSLRCLYIDRTDLMANFYPLISKGVKKILQVSLSAAAPGKNVQYFAESQVGANGWVQTA